MADVNIWHELDRQERRGRERLRRRIRRGRRAMFLVWAVLGLLTSVSGEPGSVRAGLGLFLIGGIGAALTHRNLLRETPVEEVAGGDESGGT